MADGLDVVLSVHRRWTKLIGPSDMKALMRTLGRLVNELRDERATPPSPA